MKFKRNHSKAQAAKTKFRRSSKWMKFRRHVKSTQKMDPVTGSQLSPTFTVHHMDLREERYEDLGDPERFIGLNPQTHETLHFIYNAHGGWRNGLKALWRLCHLMEKFSSD